MNLSNGVKITKVVAATAAGTTAINGTALDMAGYEGVLFVTSIATADAGNVFKAQIGSLANGTDAVDLEGASVVAAANGQTVWLDIYRADPEQRYIRPAVVRGASTAVGEIYAIQYESRKQVINNNVANTIIGKLVVNPHEVTT